VSDLRATWQDEARDFTPWLAQSDNLSILSEHLGMGSEGLELEAVEKYVGPYKADILCRNTTTGDWVLIENQLEKTDHTHLGQLLVYAAGLKAKTIIWLSKKVSAEHKVAVEWLNALSTDGTSFYALEIELWQIGDSLIAPSFNTVVRPSELTRQAESAKTGLVDGPLSTAKQELLDYWTAFEHRLASPSCRVRPVSPLSQNWLVHSIGKAGVNLNTSWIRTKNWVRAEIYLTGPNANAYFKELRSQRETIEAALGYPLEWYDAAASDRRIFVTKQFPNVVDRASWTEQHDWLRERLIELHQAFHDRVRSLDPDTAGLL
jgi:hypothetical protein